MSKRRIEQVPWRRLLGELAIIVVGVLLALWIEDWRQTRIDRQSEADYPDRLAVDVQADIKRIDVLIRHASVRSANAREVLAFIDSDRTEGDAEVIFALSRAGYLQFFNHHRATMDDLLSTGGLALLTNKALLRQVTTYYRSSDFLLQFDHQKREWVWMRYRDAFTPHVPSLVVSEVESRLRQDLDPPELTRVDWQGLRSDPAVRAGLESVIALSSVERRMLKNLQDEASTVLAALLAGGAHSETSTP